MRGLFIVFAIIIKVSECACPQGTVQGITKDRCYKIFGHQLTYQNAENACMAFGGHLTSISSAFENGFVASQFSYKKFKNIFAIFRIFKKFKIKSLFVIDIAAAAFVNDNHIWLGGTLVNGTWVWSD